MAHKGPQQPTQAHEDKKGPKRRIWRRLGRFVGSSPRQPAAPHPPHPSLARTRPTKAHKSLQRPTQAYEEEKGPKRRQTRHLGPRCVFFILFFAVLLTTTAPNDADTSFGPFRRFGFHLGLVFFFCFQSFFVFIPRCVSGFRFLLVFFLSFFAFQMGPFVFFFFFFFFFFFSLSRARDASRAFGFFFLFYFHLMFIVCILIS